MFNLKFFGGVDTVTGSRHLLTVDGKNYLIDAGNFQGELPKTFAEVDNFMNHNFATKLSAIFITHAHIDHCGFLPYIVKKGYTGPVFMTLETYELVRVNLNDAAEVLKKNVPVDKRKSAVFYDKNDVNQALSRIKVINTNEEQNVDNISFKFSKNSHILGSCHVKIEYNGKSILFSGDIGRIDPLIHNEPSPFPEADYLVTESTYGGQFHEKIDTDQIFKEVVEKTISGNRITLIPAFSIDRTQVVLFLLTQYLKKIGKDLPIILSGNLGLEATSIYEKYRENNLKISKSDYDLIKSKVRIIDSHNELEHFWKTKNAGPMIIVAGSGMINGGTIVGHLKNYAHLSNSLLVISGYQAKETPGRLIQEGQRVLTIEDEIVEVNCEVYTIRNLSAHGDTNDLLNFIGQNKYKKIFIVHGESERRVSLKTYLEKCSSEVIIPHAFEEYHLE